MADRRQQEEHDRVTNRNLFMAVVVEGLIEKGNTGTFFEDNPEAATAHRVGLREGAAVVMKTIDRLDMSVHSTEDHCINLTVDDGDTYCSVSLAEAFAASINS
ncbi:hypothetical protein MZD04_gp346 [Pseudomonas phage Psa21]|uniref:Uncharacterized protein n=1 Tax=Pseudomonas phage Psa21 TaxID=2530023 RepID=A0A481W592_9CAUD|nr:hypothetical protein MZD04_gp346 [Pseudomonas phage Psa21]QBJ02872.1 hypothetical protein PSA21_346 [Pseudomonas phage Psa21]